MKEIQVILRGKIKVWHDFRTEVLDFGEGKMLTLIEANKDSIRLRGPGHGQIGGDYGNGVITVTVDKNGD